VAVRLRTQAPGKVNLCLYLGGVRDDRRHELVTVFESVSLADTVTLTTLESGADEVVCPGVEGDNLAGAALAGLRELGWDAPPVRIEIDKRVPVAAGMGGGSADAAATLRLARTLLGIDEGRLFRLAQQLGADVPGQLVPGVSLGLDAGDLVEQVAPLAPHAIVIVPLPMALSTPAVFREADRLGLARREEHLVWDLAHLSGWLRHGARLPVDLMVNDLEPAARSLCPMIGDALAALRDAGSDAAFVCGSGPTCAGLWWGDSLSVATQAACRLGARFPLSTAVSPAGSESGAVSAG
jgi:4-diphosphocytidyl-2-C-methyl-D-erythritol kinase